MFKVCKKVSIYDILEDIVLHEQGMNSTKVYRDKVLAILQRAYNNNVLAEEIYLTLNKLTDLSLISLESALCTRKWNNVNLLINKYRTHREFRIESKSPIVDFKEGILLDIFEEVEYEYFLEERFSYNLIDLYEYVKRRKDMFVFYDEAKVKGGINYALTQAQDVNIVLFMIDMCMNDFKEKNRKINNVLAILNYGEAAVKKHNDIVNRINTGDIEFRRRKRAWNNEK